LAADVEEDRFVCGVTMGLTALATCAAELAIAEPGRPPMVSLAIATGLCVIAGGVYWWSRRHIPRSATRRIAIVGLLVLFVVPFAVEGVRLAWFGRAQPMELVLLAVLRNLGLGLVVWSRQRSFARLAALVSFFLVLLASSAADGPLVLPILGAYAAAGSLWLMLAYWRGLHFSATTDGARRFPAATLSLALIVVGGAAVVATMGPARAATALAGLFPSSGGTLWDDPDARGGVNDGENEVKGSEKPESIGFTESDSYLDSDRPSLYDAFNEVYGEPLKPKSRDKMIALSNQNITEQKERPAENLRAGRQFSAVRERPNRPARRPGEREAKALVYVKGPTPVHLGLVAYDLFDGRDWREQPHCERDCPLVLEDRNGPWFQLALPPATIFAGSVAHQVKVGTLDSSPLPAPANLLRFRVGQVNRRDFFGWSHEGMIRIEGRTIPSGTVIETEARTIDPRRLRAVSFPDQGYSLHPSMMFTDGYRLDPQVEELARSWVDNIPRGWGQVEAVVAGVQRHAAHDRNGRAPPDCDDVVAHFLLQSRRGPDYQFATAAAVLLRSLGYQTRLVSGLYAAPHRYDPRTRHTIVNRDDVHVWAEVRLVNGAWVPIEPTPGYQIMAPSWPWWERALAALTDAVRWARAHALAIAIALVAIAAMAWQRRALLDRLATLVWRARLATDPRRCAVRTLRLVERRSLWAGCPRPNELTLRQWYGPIASKAPDLAGDLEGLMRLAEWSLYSAPQAASPALWASGDACEICRRAVRGWTLGRFRSCARPAKRKESRT
jgi:hypothetical protein